MGQIWLVYARYAVGPMSKSVDFDRINASVIASGVGLLVRSIGIRTTKKADLSIDLKFCHFFYIFFCETFSSADIIPIVIFPNSVCQKISNQICKTTKINYSFTNGNNAICLAFLIALTNWR